MKATRERWNPLSGGRKQVEGEMGEADLGEVTECWV